MKMKKFFKNSITRVKALWTSLIGKLKRKHSSDDVPMRVWTEALSAYADTFCGLYTPVSRVADGTGRRPERTLSEWRDRASYRIGDILDAEKILSEMSSLIDSADSDGFVNYAQMLLKAAESDGITRDEKGTELTLDETNTNAYSDFDGGDVYLGDTVIVKTPAWYQNGKMIEPGTCTILSEAQTDNSK